MSMSAYVKSFRGRDQSEEAEAEEDSDEDSLSDQEEQEQGDPHPHDGALAAFQHTGPPPATEYFGQWKTARHTRCPAAGCKPRPLHTVPRALPNPTHARVGPGQPKHGGTGNTRKRAWRTDT